MPCRKSLIHFLTVMLFNRYAAAHPCTDTFRAQALSVRRHSQYAGTLCAQALSLNSYPPYTGSLIGKFLWTIIHCHQPISQSYIS